MSKYNTPLIFQPCLSDRDVILHVTLFFLRTPVSEEVGGTHAQTVRVL